MLTQYIDAAMRKAKYEILSDSGEFFGTIPRLKGVFGQGRSLDACRDDLQSALEEWIILGLSQGDGIPSVGGVRLVVPRARKRSA